MRPGRRACFSRSELFGEFNLVTKSPDPPSKSPNVGDHRV